jgi:hypothetical protein
MEPSASVPDEPRGIGAVALDGAIGRLDRGNVPADARGDRGSDPVDGWEIVCFRRWTGTVYPPHTHLEAGGVQA